MSKQNPFDESQDDSGAAGSEAVADEIATSAPAEPTTPPEPTDTPKRPAKSAGKPEWVAYAEYLGLSSEGTTAEIQARVDEAENGTAESDKPEEPLSKLDGSHLPISAQHGEIQGSVSINPAGVAVLTLSVFGMIGDTGLVILSDNAGDFDDVLNDLREQAKALTADAE